MEKNAGFTLMELLVVVLIIGVLVGVALPQYTKAVEKSRTAEALTLLRNLLTAEKSYKLASGDYTSDLTQLDLDLPGLDAADPSVFKTKNWKISVRTDNWENNLLAAWAVRTKADGTVIPLEKGGYTILLRVSAFNNEKVTRHCRVSLGNSAVPAICKSISGREDGYIY
ncbi:type IV pilin protein [Candidatus Avelusimicrobium aviculae]|uniref:type IV pilin protein n=1 Tax=Candidatus Avelusimicrobium aviculae TaxID=3416206 RepID=UPI003D1326EB